MAKIWKLKITGRTPPGGYYTYTQKETGVTLKNSSFKTLLRLITKHRESNKIEVGANLEFEVEQSVCENLINSGRGHLCQEVNNSLINKAKSFTKEMAYWVSKGSTFVDDATLQQRLDACMGNAEKNIARCPKWIEAKDGCKTCGCGAFKLLKLKRKMTTTKCPLGRWK